MTFLARLARILESDQFVLLLVRSLLALGCDNVINTGH